jgi:hypothetical protein
MRISVYGYVVYFCGAPIATKSKLGRQQKQNILLFRKWHKGNFIY